ncbi:MAG: heavy metal translocating P-type ATPase [Deltaproteobacteria bacterium]|jgi:Cu2+-exporting ATPase|nr:heavy metal translocating P-type ATPase [Deltaproteobacteria bacterium]
MHGRVISDLPGRLRVRVRPQDLGPDEFDRLATGLMKQGEVRYVSYNRLTGSVLAIYDAGPKRRAFILGTLERFEPQGFFPVSILEKKTIDVGEECPLPYNPLWTYVLKRIFIPRPIRTAINIIRSVPYVLRGLKELLWNRALTVEVLDAVALTVCALRRDWRSQGTLLFFFSLSNFLEAWTRRRSLSCLFHSLKGPDEKVWIEDKDGQRRQVQESQLTAGTLVVIQAGGLIPVDGTVEKGVAMVNQATMTGEPLPVHKEPGGAVFAGTTVEEGEIVIKAARVGGNTRIRSIIEYIRESEASKSGLQGRAERMADAIVPFNFLLAFLTFLFTRDLIKAGNAMLVDYSCAIRLSTPIAVLSAMREGNENGILIKGGRYLEEMAGADVCVFDKTGTLTEARPQVSGVYAFSPFSEDEALRLAACLEEHFPHPVGRAVVNDAKQKGLSHEEEHTRVDYVVAHGISSNWRGKKVLLGSRHFVVDDEKVPMTAEAERITAEVALKGESMIYLAVEGRLAAIIAISDKLRYRAKETIAKLKELGVEKTVMLTGDLKASAQSMAAKIGFDEHRAELLPDEKAAFLAQLKEDGKKIMMVGDGLNDSAALSLARVGVALSDGSELAKDVANVQLLNGRLDALPTARILSEKTMKRIRENYWVIVTLNSLFLGLGLFGVASSSLVSFLHNGTTILVAWRATKPFLAPGEKPGRKPPEAISADDLPLSQSQPAKVASATWKETT